MPLPPPTPSRLNWPPVTPISEPAHEFPFTEADFEQVRKLIYGRAGIALADSKKQMVYSRLARRVRGLHKPSFGAYLEWLTQHPNDPEWEAFTNALTTNLTSFFRENHHFDILKTHVGGLARDALPVNIWCAAASTGEEPYSLAMSMAEHFNTLTPPVRIIASDLDTQVLATGSAGVYADDRLEKVSEDQLRRFFIKGTGAQAGTQRVRQELQSLILFRQINLLDVNWSIRSPLDAIFCRNVMIYFDKPTQRRILERFAPLLRPNGLLFVGHSEHLGHVADLFAPCGKTVYRLKGKP